MPAPYNLPMDDAHTTTGGWRLPARLASGALLAAAGGIHLDLYLTGYRTIPTIGPLFLLQVIAAFALAVAVLALRSRLVALAGSLFAASTLGGYLLSIWVGLFNFKEVRTTAGIVAGVIEVAAFAVLALLAVLPDGAGAGVPWLRERGRQVGLFVAAATVAAAGLLGGAVASATGQAVSTGGSGVLRTEHVGGTTVLTNGKGFTLYWFAPDSSTSSRCYGSCTAYWPVVAGPATGGPGVTGTLGTIRRTDGTTQATYDGHPLYTYVGDSAPGQANGNNINLNGGLWHEVTVSG